MPPFKVVSDFAPAGDQPNAITTLAEGVNRGDRWQTLLGITGSGKSATIAWTIEAVQRPTLVIAPNKSLAGQRLVPCDTMAVHPAYAELPVRIELFGDDIERITRGDPLTGEQLADLEYLEISPATHYVTTQDRMVKAVTTIESELQQRLKF